MRKFYLAVVLALILVLFLRHIPSTLYNNIGYLVWSRAINEEKESVEVALPYFERAIALNPHYSQPQIGAALANYQLGNEDVALAHWQAGFIDSSTLVAYGNKEKIIGDYDKALTHFKDAARLGSDQGKILAGSICQYTLNGPEQLSEGKKAFCEAYFAENENNLIVNGRFNSGDFTGWKRRYWDGFNGRYFIENQPENDSNIAVIHGENDEEVGAISQELALKADTMIRFSARIKADLQENGQARLLHIVWTKPDGMSGGNQLIMIDESTDWEHLERTLRLPLVARDSYTFSPAILTGKGDIWIDDVQLEIISED